MPVDMMTAGVDPILASVRRILAGFIPHRSRVVVALSGGLDSVVLLHVMAQLRPLYLFELSAIHVHHGLSPNADQWAAFCQSMCAALDIPCHVARVTLADTTGQGLERAAREARYSAFKAIDGDILCLAHHQNDRAETLLLNLFRGAGVQGLAGVPDQRQIADKLLLRPLIDIPRAALLAWANAHDLQWIDDESNRDLRFRRNYIRHRVLPTISEQFPGVVQVLARTAALMQEQSTLLDRLAEQDALACRNDKGCLSVRRLQALPDAAVKNVLRVALVKAGLQIPAASRLEALTHQVMRTQQQSEVFVRMGVVGIHVWRDQIWVDHAMDLGLPAARLLQSGPQAWPDGCLVCDAKRLPAGLMLEAVGQGQRFHPHGRCRGAVGERLRERGVPPWVRPRLPALWSAHRLVWVAGLGWAQDVVIDGLSEHDLRWETAPLICL